MVNTPIVWFGAFIYIRTLCVREVKSQASLRCAARTLGEVPNVLNWINLHAQMHAQLSSREIFKFLSRCARSEGSGETALLARARNYNFHEMGELAYENLILIA